MIKFEATNQFMARLENDLYKANKLFTDLDSKFSKSINDLDRKLDQVNNNSIKKQINDLKTNQIETNKLLKKQAGK
jgi:hypothetical protein